MSKNYLRSKIKNLAGNVPDSISNENIDQFIVLLISRSIIQLM